MPTGIVIKLSGSRGNLPGFCHDADGRRLCKLTNLGPVSFFPSIPEEVAAPKINKAKKGILLTAFFLFWLFWVIKESQTMSERKQTPQVTRVC